MRRALKWLVSPAVWIALLQTAWVATLVFWIVYAVDHHGGPGREGWGVLVAGILMLAAVQAGVVVVVVHFARQVVLNRAVKDFVSRVSHDLRSPLAAVKLHLETVELRDLSDAQRRACLGSALAELGRLETGLEDVLTAARVDRRALAPARENVEIGLFLAEYAQAKRAEATLHGAQLALCEPPHLSVLADPKLLRRALDNLVDNAVVHCHKGVRIALSLAEQGGCAVLSVADDGPGLARSEWRRVFRMFHRAAPARRGGTGLGLFIVDGIARAHGGRAWVESPGPSRGCRFHVALPLAPEVR